MGPIVFIYLLLATQIESRCDKPIDLNTASISELISLPYITKSSAQLIIDIRPINSPLELTVSPKKIRGLNIHRLKNNWNWVKGKQCTKTCCKADAVGQPSSKRKSGLYSWKPGDWDECTKKCGKGTQHRDVKCYHASHIVDDKNCITLDEKPLSKKVCNIKPCPTYEWKTDTWGECLLNLNSDNNNCIQHRKVECYDTANNKLCDDPKCDHGKKPKTKQECSCKIPKTTSPRMLLWIGGEKVSGVTVSAHLLSEYNSEDCNTNMYRNINNRNNTLITRRGCTTYIFVHVDGIESKIDSSWFYLDATLDARINEIDNNVWNDNYLSWTLNEHNNDVTTGILSIALPSNGNIGKFLCNLYFQKNGLPVDRKKVADFTLYVLFNPYSSGDEVYMENVVDRNEYVENEFGLIWVGNSNDNSAMKWKYDQFHFPNLQIAMHLLHRLKLEHRNNIVLISRQISYAVAEDVCYGKWGEGPYTSGPAPNGGYECHASDKNCIEPWAWTGTTQLFDLYRDVLKYQYKAQYCQCFIFAGVSTTVGRALGLPTRTTSNFQSAHDTDFNRAIESYWIFNDESRTYSKTKGESSDSVWNFHVWNEMFFKRSDFNNPAYNTIGWQAIDATPQELSYGGNPALSDNEGAYQMGPAALALIRENFNPHKCKDATSFQERFGCFDTEFVISETNANYNFWSKKSSDAKSSKFTLIKTFQTDPWDPKFGTIGVLTNTKKPDAHVSANCLNEAIRDCDNEYLDLTLLYKKSKLSDPGEPTNRKHHYRPGAKRHRRLLWAGTNYTFFDLEYRGIAYNILTIPKKEYRSPIIVADKPNNILNLYAKDYTFALMSLNIDSFEDNELDIYCSVTATAHDYSGKQFGDSIKHNVFHFKLSAGQSSDLCQLYLHYNDYSSWVHTNFRKFDSAEIAYIFRFTITASIYDKKISDINAFDIIIEERDILVCWPLFKLRDRIICTHELDWFKPASDLKVKYECDVDYNIADGFCDDIYNYNGCYDGGDCCKDTCIPSEEYKCPYFNCIDRRVKINNEKLEKCPHISSFINYINNLTESNVCDNVFTNYECPNTNTNTGNKCIDQILQVEKLFNDDIESCYSEAIYSVQQSMIKPIIEFVIDCMEKEQINIDHQQNISGYDMYSNGNAMVNGDNYIYEQYYNYANDKINYFKSLEYEFIFVWIVLLLFIVIIGCIICFVVGGYIVVSMSNRDDNKNEAYSTSNDELSVN